VAYRYWTPEDEARARALVESGAPWAEILRALPGRSKEAVQAYGLGVRHVFVVGDVVHGYGVYRGQANDLYAVNGQQQVEAAEDGLPRYDGLEYWAIGGGRGVPERGGGTRWLRFCGIRG